MTEAGPIALRARAEALAAPLPPLLAEAEHLAATVTMGEHGRRRPGAGSAFWQYRPALPFDPSGSIDWRRSARSDEAYVRETEWQIAQSVMLWVDPSASMDYASPKMAPKKERARLLALGSAVLLTRGGERVGLSGLRLPPRRHAGQLLRLAELLAQDDQADYGAPDIHGLPPQSRALFLSDFLGDPAPVEAALTGAAERGVRGVLMMVLDPAEEGFPFGGRTIFESMAGGLRHETRQARDLKDRYLERLAERKDRLAALARATGWLFEVHHTDASAASALLWLYGALERRG
ncbi:DUF58 domain-containing protein [Pseudoroseicyclus aestuarii]|uniref:Uncharacterized protein DUF58 n=1 Tax=Pseudoroseicyclus aestuarii TaxID=1795041 RepID=A0A318SUB0_9RHOB|nr:DUF58 domain-containing protein [Pseudoroseicyclus aestuarii]PYE83836.1 uncharacterized protein DUF58 [Pseudoroseicyclus aestuarii]